MSRYEEADLRRVATEGVARRRSKVSAESLVRPAADVESFAQLWDGLPSYLAARDLRSLARAIARARAGSRPIVWMLGAHTIKVGLGPILLCLVRERLATLLAVNGAFAIHDLELALWGHTSEEVEAGLHQGRFGMARETAAVLNAAAGFVITGKAADLAAGRALAEELLNRGAAHAKLRAMQDLC